MCHLVQEVWDKISISTPALPPQRKSGSKREERKTRRSCSRHAFAGRLACGIQFIIYSRCNSCMLVPYSGGPSRTAPKFEIIICSEKIVVLDSKSDVACCLFVFDLESLQTWGICHSSSSLITLIHWLFHLLYTCQILKTAILPILLLLQYFEILNLCPLYAWVILDMAFMLFLYLCEIAHCSPRWFCLICISMI